jgi:hypothetical protein
MSEQQFFSARNERHAGQRTSLTVGDEQVYLTVDLDGLVRQVRRSGGQVVGDPQIDQPVASVLRSAGWAVRPWRGDEPHTEIILTQDPFFAPAPPKRMNRAQHLVQQMRDNRMRAVQAAPPRVEEPEPEAQRPPQPGGFDISAILASMESLIARNAELEARLNQLQVGGVQGGLPDAGVHHLPDGSTVEVPTGSAPTAAEMTGERQPENPDTRTAEDTADATEEEQAVAAAATRRGKGSRTPVLDPLADVPSTGR